MKGNDRVMNTISVLLITLLVMSGGHLLTSTHSRFDSSLESVYVSVDGENWIFIGVSKATPFDPLNPAYANVFARYTDLTYEMNRIFPRHQYYMRTHTPMPFIE